MHHPETGGAYLAQPSQVEFLKASGWQLDDPDADYDQWPAELQQFEGQPPVRMRHAEVDEEIVVAEGSAALHAERGWQRVEDVEMAALEDQTLQQLKEQARERGLPVSGTKAELIERLAEEPDEQQDDEQPAEPATTEEE
jgi:hypothetical protein